MERLEFTSVQVPPASSLLNSPPFSFSTSAYTRFGFAALVASPMRPIMPFGSPGACVISVQFWPPSVDLNNPEPGPPLDIVYSLRNASHNAAYMTLGFERSIEMSMAAVLSSRKSTFFQLLPPSVLLKTPRSGLAAECFPNAATKTMFGSVGWIRIFEMFSLDANPTFVHV